MEYTFFILFKQNGRVRHGVLRVTSITKTGINKYLYYLMFNLNSGLRTAKIKISLN